jgi:hypothetical protein
MNERHVAPEQLGDAQAAELEQQRGDSLLLPQRVLNVGEDGRIAWTMAYDPPEAHLFEVVCAPQAAWLRGQAPIYPGRLQGLEKPGRLRIPHQTSP